MKNPTLTQQRSGFKRVVESFVKQANPAKHKKLGLFENCCFTHLLVIFKCFKPTLQTTFCTTWHSPFPSEWEIPWSLAFRNNGVMGLLKPFRKKKKNGFLLGLQVFWIILYTLRHPCYLFVFTATPIATQFHNSFPQSTSSDLSLFPIHLFPSCNFHGRNNCMQLVTNENLRTSTN